MNRRYEDNLEKKCRACLKEHYQQNRDKYLEARKRWREKNQGYQTKYNKLEKYQKYRRQYYEKNKQKYAENNKRDRQQHPLKYFLRGKKYREQNREFLNKYHREWKHKKRQRNLNYKIKENLSRRIRYALTNEGCQKTAPTLSLLGATDIESVRIYLEARFEIGMTWRNYGTSWHIDHIFPCVSWNLCDSYENLLCWNYRNLAPLWSFANQSKKDAVDPLRRIYYETLMETLLF
ncbi:hypothetical protein EBZ80_01155 [bacterium]|nr:hypothetical protein [bacterium]